MSVLLSTASCSRLPTSAYAHVRARTHTHTHTHTQTRGAPFRKLRHWKFTPQTNSIFQINAGQLFRPFGCSPAISTTS